MVKANSTLVRRDMETFVAGDWVAPGAYQQMDSLRIVRLDQAGHLPASLDGRVAVYRRARLTWGQIQSVSASAPRPVNRTLALAFGTEMGS
jgi:hypothetical protein